MVGIGIRECEESSQRSGQMRTCRNRLKERWAEEEEVEMTEEEAEVE